MILIAPIKTEKGINKIEYENAMTFEVSEDATKDSIKSEVEKLFAVKVLSVNTLFTPHGKKRAVVKLKKEFKADELSAKLKMS